MSLAAAKQALYEYLCENPGDGSPVDELAGYVVRIFKGEPAPGVAPKPSAVTIFTSGDAELDDLFVISIYVDPSTDALAAQDRMDATIDAMSGLLAASPTYGRSNWNHRYDPSLDALIATTVVQVGQEDF